VTADLVKSGDLDPKYADAVPTYDLPHTNIEWRPDRVNFVDNARGFDVLCVVGDSMSNAAPANVGPGYTINTTPATSQAVCDPARAMAASP
jgi:hypothetical protein